MALVVLMGWFIGCGSYFEVKSTSHRRHLPRPHRVDAGVPFDSSTLLRFELAQGVVALTPVRGATSHLWCLDVLAGSLASDASNSSQLASQPILDDGYGTKL